MDLEGLETAKKELRDRMAEMRKEFETIQTDLKKVKKLLKNKKNKEKGKIYFKLRPFNSWSRTGGIYIPYRDDKIPTIQIDLKNHPHPNIRKQGVIHIYTNDDCEVVKVEKAGPGYKGSWMLAKDDDDAEYFVNLEQGENESEKENPYTGCKIGGEAYWVHGGDPLDYGDMICQLSDDMITIEEKGVEKVLSVPWQGDGSVIVVWMNDNGKMDGDLEMH